MAKEEAAQKKPVEFDLRGKDFFSQKEAAHYSCMCPAAFRTWAEKKRIPVYKPGPKLIYERKDLYKEMKKNALNIFA